jgi:hypothetical protein
MIKGYFNNTVENNDKSILFIPSYFNSHWSKEMNKIFKKDFFNYDINKKEESYLRYHKLTFEYYHRFFDEIRNNNDIKWIFYQNLLTDFDWRIAKLTNKKICGFLHSFLDLDLNTQKTDLYEKFVIDNSDYIFCCSDFFKSLLIKKGYNENKIKVVGYPFKRIDCDFSEKENILIFNHRLYKNKNPILFLETVVPNLLEKYKDLKIYVFTVDFSTDYLKKFKEFKHERFFVYVNNNELYHKTMKKAKFGISLSDFDTFGTAFGFALINGIYYFVPNKMAFPEIADPNLLYNNIEDFYEKFDKIYNNYDISYLNNIINNFYNIYEDKVVINKIRLTLIK